MVEAVKERTQVGGDRTIRGEFMQQVGLHFDELHDGVAAKPAPVEDERRVVRGRRMHRHRHLVPAGDHLPPMAQSHPFVHARHGFILGLQPGVPVEPRVFIEGGLGEVAAQAVVNLPRDQLGMLAQRLGHVFHDAPGIIPEDIAVQTDGAAGAFMFDATLFVERENFRMFLGEPDWRGGGGGAEHNLDACPAEKVHHPFEPAEIKLAVLRFAQPPGKFPDADHVDARLNHQFDVGFPSGFRVFGGAAVREDPLLGMIINAKIHKVSSRVVPGV